LLHTVHIHTISSTMEAGLSPLWMKSVFRSTIAMITVFCGYHMGQVQGKRKTLAKDASCQTLWCAHTLCFVAHHTCV
jgi:hypothetical protein